MKVTLNALNKHSGYKLVTTCPWCSHGGTFEEIGSQDISSSGIILGLRRCPNPKCHCQLFFIYKSEEKIKTYPPLRIDFNTDNIPKKIIDIFNQAITCHSEECYIASAIMIRRTLEELCKDKGVSGDNLKTRIQNLKNIIILPEELFYAMDELRLIGNDAAHVESKDYDDIGEDEVKISIELTKEILKSCYQYTDLLNKLKSMKN